jgi:thioredoxin 1
MIQAAKVSGGHGILKEGNANMKENVSEDVLKLPGLVLVYFYGDHCPLCHHQAPILEEVALNLEGRVRIVKMAVEKNSGLARRLGVVALPTVIVLNDGKMEARMVGLQNKARLLEAIQMTEGEGA